MGASHHFFLTRRNLQISERLESAPITKPPGQDVIHERLSPGDLSLAEIRMLAISKASPVDCEDRRALPESNSSYAKNPSKS